MEENVVQSAKHEGAPTVNRARHEAQCSICASPYRQEIEEAFINWRHPTDIAKDYDVTRDAIYRHAHACDLFSKRRRNVIMALETIIEQTEWHLRSCTASAVVSAAKLHAKFRREEEEEEAKVKAAQSPNLMKLLAQMTQAERDAFARDGSLPEWLLRAIGATPTDRQEDEKDSNASGNTRVQ
jgi:hypothetical protein